MKPAPLLLFLPLLFPVQALAARPLTKPEVRADGRYEFRDRGRLTKFRIATDELQQSGVAGIKRIPVSAKDHLRKIQDEAKTLSGADRKLDLVAYPEGKPQTEANRRVVTNKVSITLNEGMDPTTVGLAIKAIGMKEVHYSPGDFVLEFNDASEAITAAEALQTVPGILRANLMLASKRTPAFEPNDSFFPPRVNGLTAGPYFTSILPDYSEVKVILAPPTVLTVFVRQPDTRAFQWYLNKEVSILPVAGVPVQIPGVFLSNYKEKDLPSYVDPEQLLPVFSKPRTPALPAPKNGERTYPTYLERIVDINVRTAWDITTRPTLTPTNSVVPGKPVDGKGVRVAVIDDGVQLNHPDLNVANVMVNDDRNFLEGSQGSTTDALSGNPTPPAGSGANHGTAVAGIILGRRENARGISGISPDAKLAAYRITRGYVDEATFANAQVWDSTLVALAPGTDDPFGIKRANSWRQGTIKFDICNNGWESGNAGSDLSLMDDYFRKALNYGVSTGRFVDGAARGVIYVFPAGNDGESHGNTNYSVVTNSIYGIVVGSVSDLGRQVLYSNPGASLHVVTPSSGGEMAPRIQVTNQVSGGPAVGAFSPVIPPTNSPLIPTVPGDAKKRALGWTVNADDWDHPNSVPRQTQRVLTWDTPATATGAAGYNNNFGGTSASSAMVSGIVALMLEVNPKLGWRDVQEILMRSAKVIDPMMGEWQYNNLGMPMSHKYGAGLVDAERAVRMAKVWINLGARFGTVQSSVGTRDYKELIPHYTSLVPNGAIPDSAAGQLLMSATSPPPANLRLEHIVVRLKVKHGRRGDLGVILTAPVGGQADTPVESYLMVPHREDYNQNIGLPDVNPTKSPRDSGTEGEYWDFTTVRHWGTSTQNGLLGGGVSPSGSWTVTVWDNTTQKAVTAFTSPAANLANPNVLDRVYVPVNNPVTEQKVVSGGVFFYGTTEPSANEPPVILTNSFAAKTARPFQAAVAATSDLTPDPLENTPRAPIYDHRIRVVKTLSANTPEMVIAPNTAAAHNALFPEPITTPAADAGKSPAFLRFDRLTGVLTNAAYPAVGVAAPFKPLPKGSWLLEIQSTSIFGTTRKQVVLDVTDPLTYAQWKASYFTAAELVNPLISGDAADPDGDGIPNLLEYGMGGKPKANEPYLLPKQTIVGNNVLYTFQTDSSAEFRVVPQISSNLVTWQDVSNSPGTVLTSQAGSLNYYTVTVPIAPNSSVYFRLKSTTAPPVP